MLTLLRILVSKRKQTTDQRGTEATLGANPAGFAVFKLLLRMFPDKEHLSALDNEGSTPLHHAAYFTNKTSIEIMVDHAAVMGQPLDLNVVNRAGLTPLSACGGILSVIRLGDNDEHVSDSLKLQAAKTYQYLRGLGACLPSELKPIPVAYVSSDPSVAHSLEFQHTLLQTRSLTNGKECSHEHSRSWTEKVCWHF